MIDINNTLDLVKLKFYNEWLYVAHIYDEGESGFHKELTQQVVEKYIDTLNLSKDSVIMDLGCGPGYFLDEMKQRGYTNLTGVTLSPGDIKLCTDKGHKVKPYDLSFIPQKDGWNDESVDLIFLRHALEHSPYPIFSLMEYNRLLKQHGKLYIEVPAPDCERAHEFNLNHYSIFGEKMLVALLQRTGFDIEKFETIEFDLQIPYKNSKGEWELEEAIEGENPKPKLKAVREKFFCVVANKQRPLDVK